MCERACVRVCVCVCESTCLYNICIFTERADDVKLTREISVDTIIIIRAETNTVPLSTAVTRTTYGRIWRKGAGKRGLDCGPELLQQLQLETLQLN